MTKLSNVISIDGSISYEEALNKHLKSLTDKQKSARVSDMMVVANTEYGSLFTVVLGNDTTYLIGLLEMIKIYLLTSIDGEEYE